MRKFVLTLDDFAPHPKTGQNFESIGWCKKLIEKFPELKIGLFVPAAYCRLGEEPRYLSKNKEWCKKVSNLGPNFKVYLHGYYHRRIDPRHEHSNNDEFQFLTEKEALVTLSKMECEFNSAQLKYEKVFRAPGWKMSISTTKVLTQRGFVIAGNKDYYDKNKKHVPESKWVVANWHLTPECDVKDGDIIAAGHTSNWLWNYMDEERYKIIIKMLKKEEFEFKFVEEMPTK